jgi:asparagine synthase (glutamine-hydrolysing)
MCGIAGIVNLSGANPPARARALQRMTDTLAHRGPDDNSIVLTDSAGLGHTRLSIIDLDAGGQPMWNARKSHCIVFNGEIYNYVELRSELCREGYRFATKSDTEVILALYERRGESCVDYLNGMFSFAIWDSEKRKLFAARDRLGEKPLYYCEADNGDLVFASELKALLKHPHVEPRVSLPALGQYLSQGYISSPLSIYDAVYKLPAAHTLSLSGDGLVRERYWSVDGGSASDASGRDDWLEQLDELIGDAVRLRLRSDVPVGAFLSGGIDSSLICHYASHQYPGDLDTFTVKVNDSFLADTEHARTVAHQIGSSHRELEVGAFDLTALPRLVAQFDEPFADPSSLPTYYVTKAASEFLKVCLSGDGGDELFGGYARYGTEPIEGLFNELPRPLARKLSNRLSRMPNQHVQGMGWMSRMLSDPVTRYLAKTWLFSPDEQRRFLTGPLLDAGDQFAEQRLQMATRIAGARQDWPLLYDQETYLPEDILVKVDRMSMLNSLEVRVPLLDHRICEFANSLRPDVKYAGNVLKKPLKQLLAKHFNSDLIEQRKRGFGLPLSDWFKRGTLFDMFQDVVLQPDSAVGGYADLTYVRGLLRDNRGRDYGRKLWSLLWLELWFREHASR